MHAKSLSPILAFGILCAGEASSAVLTESTGPSSYARCGTDGNGIAGIVHREYDSLVAYPGGTYPKRFIANELRVYRDRPQDSGGPGLAWLKNYGYLGEWFPYGIVQSADNGFALSGYTLDSQGNGVYYARPVLLRVDTLGNPVWSRVYRIGSGDRIRAMLATPDSGLLLAGEEGPRERTRAAAFRLDKDGFGLWNRTYGGDFGTIHHAQATPDGGYLLAGTTRDSASATGWDDLLVKTDSQGNTLWSRTYPGSGEDILYSADTAQDGGYILAGSTTSLSGLGGRNVQVLKVDALGNVQWVKEFGTTGVDWANAIKSMDGGYVFAAQMYNLPPFNNDEVRIWKLSAAGATLWNKHFDGTLGPENQTILAHAPGQFTFHTSNGAVRVFDTDFSAPRMKVTGSVDAAAQTAALHAHGLGTNLSYQWKKDGIAIPGATSATLSYGPAPDAATGFYSCTVSNPNGATEPVFSP